MDKIVALNDKVEASIVSLTKVGRSVRTVDWQEKIATCLESFKVEIDEIRGSNHIIIIKEKASKQFLELTIEVNENIDKAFRWLDRIKGNRTTLEAGNN